MGVKSFKELDVYNIAFEASVEIHLLTKSFPKDEIYGLTSQIRRSSKSICANIAEGFSKQRNSKPEFKRYLYIAVGSASEVIVWLNYCQRLGYINEETSLKLEKEYTRIESMLNSFISKIQ